MKIKPRKIQPSDKYILKELKEGISYVYKFIPIRDIILLLAIVSAVGMPYAVLMPIIAKDILGGGPHTLGLLMAAAGGGALIGAFYLASRKNVLGLIKIIPITAGIFGIGLVAFSFSTQVWLSMLILVLVGFGMMVQMAASNTLLQTLVDDNKRGRVMSLFMMAFVGMAPIGSLYAGTVASSLGAPHTILISGLLCVVCSLIFWVRLPHLRSHIRPIFIKMGIIPEVTEGIASVSQLTSPPEE